MPIIRNLNGFDLYLGNKQVEMLLTDSTIIYSRYGGDPVVNPVYPDDGTIICEYTAAREYEFEIPKGTYELKGCTGGSGGGYSASGYNGTSGASGCLLTATLEMPTGIYKAKVPSGGWYGTSSSKPTGETGGDFILYKKSGDNWVEYLHMINKCTGGSARYMTGASKGAYYDSGLNPCPVLLSKTMEGNGGKNGANSYVSGAGGDSPVKNAAESGKGGHGKLSSESISASMRSGKPGYFRLKFLHK